MNSPPEPPPEAAIITVAREAAGLTIADAVRVAQRISPQLRMSNSRWSQIENGYEVRAGGIIREVTAKPGTLAHMAYVTQADPEQLRATGRPNAIAAIPVIAEIRRRQDAESSRQPPAGQRDAPPLLSPGQPAGAAQSAEDAAFLPASPAMEAAMAPHIMEIGGLVRDRILKAPGGRVPGAGLFADPREAAAWDLVTGDDYPAEAAVRFIAGMRVRAAEAQDRRQADGHAAGLTGS